jgi:putative FmdB family regulatory protein
MPVYEYRCAACGHQFEEWQKITDAPVKTCPACKKKKVERLISATSFQLKGGGWYKDLYATPRASQSSSDDAPSSSSESKASDSKAKSEAGSKPDGGSKSDGGSKKEAKADKKPSRGTKASTSAAA